MTKPRDRTLQEAMRARRQAKPLLTVEELRQREAEREQSATQDEAGRLVELWRRTGARVDAGGALPPSLYRAIFALDRDAYDGSGHWARRTKGQLAAATGCEVERCDKRTDLTVCHIGRPSPGEERVSVDLVALCDPCGRRKNRKSRALSRPLTRGEIVKLDPSRPLYEPAAIAALKARYSRPLRRSDLPS